MATVSKLILASASPRRQELLRDLGIPFRAIPSLIEEDLRQGEGPEEHVMRLCEAKARDVAQRYPEHWVIGADTIVFAQGTILGKPKTSQEARGMLEALQGRAHEVYTGICVLRLAPEQSTKRVVRTAVHFRTLSREEMDWYIRTGEPFDKAGSYAVQGYGGVFVRAIEGSYSNVVGLPVTELVEMLRDVGAWDLFNGS